MIEVKDVRVDISDINNASPGSIDSKRVAQDIVEKGPSCDGLTSLSKRGRGPEAFTPLYVEMIPKDDAGKARAAKMKDVLMSSDEFNLKVPFPSAAKSSPAYGPDIYWRGRVWIDQVYYASKGLANYGYEEEAVQQLEKVINNASGVSSKDPYQENYNPETGGTLGATNFSWTAAMMYISYRDLLVDSKIPVYPTQSDVQIALDHGDMDNILNRYFSPSTLREEDDGGNIKLNALVDQGNWHGWGLPGKMGDPVDLTKPYGFSGPLLVVEEYSATIASQLLELDIYDDQGVKKFTKVSSLTNCKPSYLARPGALHSTGCFTNGTLNVMVQQKVVGVSADDATTVNGPMLDSNKSRTTIMSTTFKPSLKSGVKCSAGNCDFTIKIGGRTFTNDEINTGGKVLSSFNLDGFYDEDKEKPLHKWKRTVTADTSGKTSKVFYKFGAMHRAWNIIVSDGATLFIEHNAPSIKQEVGCFTEGKIQTDRKKCGSNYTIKGESVTALETDNYHMFTIKSTDLGLCGLVGYYPDEVLMTLITGVSWVPDAAASGKIAGTTVIEDVENFNANNLKCSQIKPYVHIPKVEETGAMWQEMIKDALYTKKKLPFTTTVVQKTLDSIALKSVETLMGNWRSPAGALTSGGVVPSTTSASFNGIWAWDSWKESAALSYFNTKVARVAFEGFAVHQVTDNDINRPWDAGMMIDCAFINKYGENWNERNTKPPLAVWALDLIYQNMNILNSTDSALLLNKAWAIHWVQKMMTYHNWFRKARDNNNNGILEYGATLDPLQTLSYDGKLGVTFNVTMPSGDNEGLSKNQLCTVREGDPKSFSCQGDDLYGSLIEKNTYESITPDVQDATAWESGRDNAGQFGYIEPNQLKAYADTNYSGDVNKARKDWQAEWYQNVDRSGNHLIGPSRGSIEGYSMNQESVDLAAYYWKEKQLLLNLDKELHFLDASDRGTLLRESDLIQTYTNDCMWKEDDGWYYDVQYTTSSSSTSTLGSSNDLAGKYIALIAVGWSLFGVVTILFFLLWRHYKKELRVLESEEKHVETATIKKEVIEEESSDSSDSEVDVKATV